MCFIHNDYSDRTYAPDPGLRVGQSVLTPEQMQAQAAAGGDGGLIIYRHRLQLARQALRAQNAAPPQPAATGTFGLQLTPPSTGMMQLRTGRS